MPLLVNFFMIAYSFHCFLDHLFGDGAGVFITFAKPS